MNDIFLLIILIIIVLLPITYSFITLLLNVLKNPSVIYFQLLISASSLLIWSLLIIPIYVTPELFTETQIILIDHLSSIIGSIGVLFFMFSIINTFSYKLVIFPRISIVGFSIIIGSIIIQLILPNTQTIYGIKLVNGQLIRVSPIYFSILIFISYGTLYIAVTLFIIKQNELPSYIVYEKVKQYSIYAFIVLNFGMLFQTIGTIFIFEANSAGWFLIGSRIFITTGFIFIVLQFTGNPLLSFSENGNPSQLISNGTINWLLIGNRDLGPEPLARSSALKNFFSPEAEQLLTIKLMTSISLGREEYAEEICIIPFSSSNYNLIAVGFSFLHKDSESKDPRKNGYSELLYAVIIPNLLLVYLHNLTIDSMRNQIMPRVMKTTDLKDFLSVTDFNQLSVSVLRTITSKKLF